MFKRRTPLTASQVLRDFIWPRMGWKRMGHYIQLRMVRIKGSTRSIAAGFAFGAAISFTPLPGSHIFTAGLLSYLTRSNILASVVGTVIGNPWTFPIMWWGAYKMGTLAFLLFGASVTEMPTDLTWDYLITELTERPMDLMVPWVVGGVLLMILSWPIFYFICYRMVDKMRRRYKRYHPKEHAP